MFETSLSPAQHIPAPESVRDALASALGGKAQRITMALGEVTVVVKAADYAEAALILRDEAG